MRALPLVLIALALLPACSESKKETRQERREERREARQERRERLGGGERGRGPARFDADGDGTITRDEFKGRPRRFERLDKNGDGKLTSDEF